MVRRFHCYNFELWPYLKSACRPDLMSCGGRKVKGDRYNSRFPSVHYRSYHSSEPVAETGVGRPKDE